MIIKGKGIDFLPEFAKEILSKRAETNVIAFYGDLGAGKTTLVKEICKQLGVEDEVKSPTFSIVNEYQTSNGEAIYHFDFYRIKSIEEALDIGIEEYFDSGSLLIMEWPENIEGLLPSPYLKIKIEYSGEDKRNYSLSIG